MNPLRLFALVAGLACACFAQNNAPSTALPVETPAKARLDVARNGNEVLLTWSLPEGKIRLLEIMRHTRPEGAGRGRVAGVRADPPFYADAVPDAQATYWYWLKITHLDGRIENIGPIATPSAQVWRPAS